MKKIVSEALVIAVAGATLAFAANALSPRGLKLTTNYFPAVPVVRPAAPNAANTNPGPGTDVAATLRNNGLQLADSNLVASLLHDPRYEQQLVAIIDARPDDQYKQGHIPGAYQFDHFHAENYAAALMPVCQNAQQIVVYCGGGDCELSQNAAIFLRDSFAVPSEKLFVYAGGMEEWIAAHLPVEVGVRNSGAVKAAK